MLLLLILLGAIYLIVGGYIEEILSPDKGVNIFDVLLWPIVLLAHLGNKIRRDYVRSTQQMKVNQLIKQICKRLKAKE